MNQFNYQEAFGAVDRTTDAMQKAIGDWYDLYYGRNCPKGQDPGQRIAYTIVSKLVKTVFGEYQTQTNGAFAHGVVTALNEKSREAMHQTLVGGECYLKPWVGERVTFGVIPRCNALIFGRNGRGEPVDMGTVFDEFEEIAHSDYFEREGAEESVRLNRRLLYNVMMEAGFTNYDCEWWLYDWGNRSWARINKCTSIYHYSDSPDLK